MKTALILLTATMLLAGCVQEDTFNPQGQPSASVEQIRVTKFDYNITEKKMDDGTPYRVFSMQMFFEGHKKLNTPQYQKINVSISSATVNEKGERTRFMNEEDFLKVDGEYVYGVREGSFSTSENIRDNTPHNYTTIFTLNDYYGKTTANKTIYYKIP